MGQLAIQANQNFDRQKRTKGEMSQRPTHYQMEGYTYILLTEFEGRTVSYGPSFFPPRFMAQVRSARAINRRGKNEDP